jgi:hypothetical protein
LEYRRSPEAAEKVHSAGQEFKSHPAVAKAMLIMGDLTARINSCPFKSDSLGKFFRSLF